MNKAILAVLAIVALQLSLVSAHGWLIEPEPAGFRGDNDDSANSTSPCGFGIGPTPESVQRFTHLRTAFTTGTNHPTGRCRVTLATAANATAFNDKSANVLNIECPADRAYENDIFITRDPGTYYMQWVWEYNGGRWYGCAQVDVTPAPITTTTLNVGQSTSGDLSANTNRYWEINVPTDNFVRVDITGTGTTFGASNTAIPTSASSDVAFGQSGTVTLCSGSDTPSMALIGAFSGTSSGSYSLTAANYNGLVEFGASAVEDTLPAGGYKLYGTDAFDTSSSPKRVIVRRTSGEGGIAVKSLGGICTLGGAPSTYESTSCVSVGTSQSRKFYGVYTDSGASYSIAVEQGHCNRSSVSAQVSFLLVLSSFLLSIML